MTETCKQTPEATEAFMGLVEDQISNLKQKLAEAEEKIRTLQEEIVGYQRAVFVQSGDSAKQKLAEAEAKIRILQENAGALIDQKAELVEANTRLADEIKRLQGMGIQQNEQGVLTHLRDEARSEHKRIKDEHLAALGIKDADVFQQLKPENAFKSRSEQGG